MATCPTDDKLIKHEVTNCDFMLESRDKNSFDFIIDSMGLVELHGIELCQLIRTVKRNIDRFPDDFVFQLTKQEFENLRCQFGTSSWSGNKYGKLAMNEIIPIEKIESKIYTIRNQKVLLDRDLAELYGVETRILVQAVKRNIDRFPKDFMFQIYKN